jgi:tetratricopeptide (TPR) repeat protein
VFTGQGKLPEALAALEKSRRAKERILGDDHPDVFRSAMNIGNVLELAGRHEEALATDRSARVALSRLIGSEHPLVAMVWFNEGDALNSLHRYAEARADYSTALEIWLRAGADPFFRSFGLTGLGQAYLGEGRPADAVAPLQEALRIRLAREVDSEHLGEVRFALARALWSRPAERKNARALAQQARADYVQAGAAAPKAALAQIDAWLQTAR